MSKELFDDVLSKDGPLIRAYLTKYKSTTGNQSDGRESDLL